MGNFGTIVDRNYASPYLKIDSNDFLETLRHDRAQEVDKNHLKFKK